MHKREQSDQHPSAVRGTTMATWLGLLGLSAITGCGRDAKPEVQCGVRSGEVVLLDSGPVRIRVPLGAEVIRAGAPRGQCGPVQGFRAGFYWDGQRLTARSRTAPQLGDVIVFIKGTEPLPGLRASPAWKYQGAVRSKHYPLVLYPRYWWDSPTAPSALSVAAGKFDPIWGVEAVDRNALIGRRFRVTCPLEAPGISEGERPEDVRVAVRLNLTCRASYSIEKGRVGIKVMVDVPTAKAHEIDRILIASYDAVLSTIQG